jgi:hypothetical protein
VLAAVLVAVVHLVPQMLSVLITCVVILAQPPEQIVLLVQTVAPQELQTTATVGKQWDIVMVGKLVLAPFPETVTIPVTPVGKMLIIIPRMVVRRLPAPVPIQMEGISTPMDVALMLPE